MSLASKILKDFTILGLGLVVCVLGLCLVLRQLVLGLGLGLRQLVLGLGLGLVLIGQQNFQ